MAANLLPFQPSGISASSAPTSSSDRRTRLNPTRPGPSSSSGWWTPLFGWSSEPDYIDSKAAASGPDPAHNKTSTRFAPGAFTDEKARQLRMMTRDTGSFHDVMYHSAIASRLASDFGRAQPDL